MKEARLHIRDRAEAIEAVKKWRADGLCVVFTNGCFDLLHLGHIKYLEQARALGDKLVVGLNTDNSVRKLKGPTRPINDLHARAYVLASLATVDLVTPFEEETPRRLIRALKPDVLVKGGDYRVDQIVGAEDVLRSGGRVRVIPFVPGYSTSSIEQKILKRHTSQ